MNDLIQENENFSLSESNKQKLIRLLMKTKIIIEILISDTIFERNEWVYFNYSLTSPFRIMFLTLFTKEKNYCQFANHIPHSKI